MIKVRVKHSFGAFDLDATFEAPAGLTVLFGRSGSGKTTLINAVAGLLRPDSGQITIDDWVLVDTETGRWLPPPKRRIGYIFQEARLFPHLSVDQNLSYGAWFAPKDGLAPDRRHLTDMLGIGHLLDRRPQHLSGGERQRVAIGRALLACPRLILADEPLAALDDARKAEILPYFERLRDEVEVPILYVSHAAAEVARLATTVVVVEGGRVSHQGPAAQVLSDPDVTPLGSAAAGALLSARLVRHHPDGISELTAGGIALLLPAIQYPPGTALRVRIEAQDVMLATEKPRAVSALNVLPATLQNLRRGSGPGVMAQLRVGDNLILARITQRSCDAMSLRPGMALFAVIKAVSMPRDAVGDVVQPRPQINRQTKEK